MSNVHLVDIILSLTWSESKYAWNNLCAFSCYCHSSRKMMRLLVINLMHLNINLDYWIVFMWSSWCDFASNRSLWSFILMNLRYWQLYIHKCWCMAFLDLFVPEAYNFMIQWQKNRENQYIKYHEDKYNELRRSAAISVPKPVSGRLVTQFSWRLVIPPLQP